MRHVYFEVEAERKNAYLSAPSSSNILFFGVEYFHFFKFSFSFSRQFASKSVNKMEKKCMLRVCKFFPFWTNGFSLVVSPWSDKMPEIGTLVRIQAILHLHALALPPFLLLVVFLMEHGRNSAVISLYYYVQFNVWCNLFYWMNPPFPGVCRWWSISGIVPLNSYADLGTLSAWARGRRTAQVSLLAAIKFCIN